MTYGKFERCEGNIRREILVKKMKVNKQVKNLHSLRFTFHVFLTSHISLEREKYKLSFDVLFV